ncbi:MAG: energy transducer TonB [Candidatus Zixiibacteriota bacterium]
MEITKRDIFFSLLFHIGLLASLTLLNPFKVVHQDFESIGLNIIEMPPLGNPELIQGAETPEIVIPEALEPEEEAIPLETPESREIKKEVEKPKEQPKPKPQPKPKEDQGYTGQPKTGDKSQAGTDGTDVSDQLGPGSKFGKVGVDNANFNFPSYFMLAFTKIERNWTNPVNANQPLSCKIHFMILRTGTIVDPTVKTSSGVEAYDRACMRALQISTPLPPLPSEFQDDIIGITLEFPYEPR